ncbi:hypothetical protein PF004_g23149 [Phytophthora fragariae]|uniref:Secreted protein n=1 Tax=Phytophthora fragariae TaxID=53985 RepID=A0A6G0MZU6_9STRA|nr:hypothetical protein PF004_g23149 [Phytophthora fragariae]
MRPATTRRISLWLALLVCTRLGRYERQFGSSVDIPVGFQVESGSCVLVRQIGNESCGSLVSAAHLCATFSHSIGVTCPSNRRLRYILQFHLRALVNSRLCVRMMPAVDCISIGRRNISLSSHEQAVEISKALTLVVAWALNDPTRRPLQTSASLRLQMVSVRPLWAFAFCTILPEHVLIVPQLQLRVPLERLNCKFAPIEKLITTCLVTSNHLTFKSIRLNRFFF